jgi:heterodisulfide reductase subunit A
METSTTYDALVIGSGIGGMEAAIKLGDMGHRVLVVEKEPSIGGKMILLSKVFPTLDCASCISTPKMAATAHHPNVTVLTQSVVESVRGDAERGFQVTVRRSARYVDEALCTGCRLCETACTVAVPDQFNGEMVSRRAAYIPFPQAIPQKALVERPGTSPCTFGCPAGIKAHGYVSLVRSGRYEEAFSLVAETTPLVGTLGRACYAPCETECTRGSLEGPVSIRRLKRFIADTHYALPEPPTTERPPANGKRVAVVGSGPAGLTAAWQLARQGYGVRIFEAAPAPGGAPRLSIPAYRLPAEVVERDVANVTDLGVEIVTGKRVDDLEELRRQGFDTVLVATGTPRPARLRVPGEEELGGVRAALDFLRDIRLGQPPDLSGKVVAVIGGGNVAIDTARSARRLGAAAVHMVCLERRGGMPAYAWEVGEALDESVELHDGWGIAGFRGEAAVEAVELKRCTAVFDEKGRFAPSYDEATRDDLRCDLALVAIGMGADTAAFPLLSPSGARGLQADPITLQTALPWVFAAGDAVTGPKTIAEAVGHGRRAAHMIDRWLRDLPLAGFDAPLPVVDKAEVLARQRSHSLREPLDRTLRLVASPTDFAELEPALTESKARQATGRCLDCGVCSECHQCLAACPADAIDLGMRPQKLEVEVSAVVVSTGYRLFPADLKPQYGWGRFKNVITGTQMERLLAPTRPYNTVLRPGDGRVPERIAYVMCTGSRDQTVGNPLCSKFCCMYSLKQNQLIMGALPLADVTVHYIDIRAAGKGYDEFFEQAKAMGTTFVKGRVAGISETADGNLILRYEDIDGGGVIAEAEYDLVVLAVGVQPNPEAAHPFADGALTLDEHGYVAEVDEDLNPGATSIPGVFVAGAASGARDIPESILHSGAAVAQAAAQLERRRVPG